MMLSSLLLAVAVGVLVIVGNVSADLPVHCLNVQIAGDWVFELSDDKYDSSVRCGHKVPDSNMDHFTKAGYNLEVVKKIQLTLKEPNIVVDAQGDQGTWTMIYDEGFEVRIGGKRYFAFSRYVPKTPESLSKDDVEDYISICTETLVGWFHDDDNTHWGCYHGYQTSSAGKKFGNSGPKLRLKKQAKRPDDNIKILSPKAFKRQDDNLERLERDAMFEPDVSFIELHNSNSNSLWRAGIHEQFLSKRMSDMMHLLGKSKHKNQRRMWDSLHAQTLANRQRQRQQSQSFSQLSSRTLVQAGMGTGSTAGSVLPDSFDWRNHNGVNYDSPVKNQGNCGSCFAMASIYVAESRARILTANKLRPSLSTQVVSCSIYNQGCDGGYPFLVGKHGFDHGIVPESCFPYIGEDSNCQIIRSADCPDPRNPPRFRVSNYTYIGGYYGGCNEDTMMREIYENGPIMVAFDAPSSLFYYTGGIYTGEAPPHEGPKLPSLNQWEKTNHAVTAVGWGIDPHTRVQYWIIKNTWGETWGENGYFKIRRGTDECGIESMAVTMHMVLPQQYQHLQA